VIAADREMGSVPQHWGEKFKKEKSKSAKFTTRPCERASGVRQNRESGGGKKDHAPRKLTEGKAIGRKGKVRQTKSKQTKCGSRNGWGKGKKRSTRKRVSLQKRMNT